MISARLGFLIKPKKELILHLQHIDSDLDEYFLENYVVFTEELDYEKHLEGWKKTIREKVKLHFITESVYDTLEYSDEKMHSIFGTYHSEIHLFDKWWYFEEADCSQMPTDWETT